MTSGAAEEPPSETSAIDGSTIPATSSDIAQSMSRHQLVGLFVLVVIVRYWFSANRTFFNISPDEPANLGMARWISGTGPWNMFNASTWSPGFPALLAPLFWLTGNEGQVIRGGLIINALLGGVGALLLAVLTLRLTRLPPRFVVVVSAIIALTPASLAASAHVWAEPIVTVCFLATTLTMLAYFDEPRLRTGAFALGWAIIGFTSHGRLLPLVVMATVLTVVRSIAIRRISNAVILLAVGAAGTGLSILSARIVVDHVWESPEKTNSISSVAERLTDPVQVLDAAAGQIWYQLVATAMLVGVGAAVLVRSSATQQPGSSLSLPSSGDARVLLALVIPMVALSAVFMSDRPRPDQLIYGRYNDAIVWPILAVGFGWLIANVAAAQWRALAWIAGGVSVVALELALLIQQLHGRTISSSWGIAAMIPGIVALAPESNSVSSIRITVAAIAIFVALLLTSRIRHVNALLPLCLCSALLVVGGVRTRHALDERLNGGLDSAEAVREIESIIPPGTELGVRFVPDLYGPLVPSAQQLSYAFFYEWALPEYRFRIDFGDDEVGPYVFAPTNDPLFIVTGAPIVWDDPQSEMALWFELTPPNTP